MPVIFVCTICFSQAQTTFNYNYPYEYYYHLNNMSIINQQYFIGGGIKLINPTCEQWCQGLHITKINQDGVFDEFNSISKCNWLLFNTINNFYAVSDSIFFFAGQEFSDTSQHNDLFFLKLNSNLDTLALQIFYEDTLAKRHGICAKQIIMVLQLSAVLILPGRNI
jgi:hypothetical protein